MSLLWILRRTKSLRFNICVGDGVRTCCRADRLGRFSNGVGNVFVFGADSWVGDIVDLGGLASKSFRGKEAGLRVLDFWNVNCCC